MKSISPRIAASSSTSGLLDLRCHFIVDGLWAAASLSQIRFASPIMPSGVLTKNMSFQGLAASLLSPFPMISRPLSSIVILLVISVHFTGHGRHHVSSRVRSLLFSNRRKPLMLMVLRDLPPYSISGAAGSWSYSAGHLIVASLRSGPDGRYFRSEERFSSGVRGRFMNSIR